MTPETCRFIEASHDVPAIAVRREQIAGILGGMGLLVAAASGWHDAFVLLAMAAVVAGTRRRILAVGAACLFTVAFPPFSWPTWWICLAPLFWIWRDRDLQRSAARLVAEAVAIGFAMCWLSTGFVRAAMPAWGSLIHAAACVVFSLQLVVLALAVHWTRGKPIVAAAPICALTAVAGDLFEAWCGVSWSVTNLALTVATTPLAQWSHWITPFGVSGLLYLVNFTLACENTPSLGRRWLGPALGSAIAGLAWFGGCLVAASVSVTPLPFSVLLLQPHAKVSKNESWRPWLKLDRITRATLSREGPVDLIVWPESSLSESRSDAQPEAVDIETRLTIQDFSRLLTPTYKTNCLAGVTVLEPGTTVRYGLEVAEVRRYNCGCLVSESGAIVRHEKLDLVPLKEGLPRLLDHQWIRTRLLPEIQLNAPLAPGREFGLLSFRDRRGKSRSIAVCVCYESLLPWLPQYRDEGAVDAIVHLVYDGNTAEHPGMIERQIRGCQYRAIETRKWNLVCSTWSGSTVIDPCGRIVSQMAATAGVLRSDVANGKGN